MNLLHRPRHALRGLTLTLVVLGVAVIGGFTGCGGSDDSSVGRPDAAMTDATTIDGESCSAPDLMCGSSCVSTQTDGSNCGVCGRICGNGTACEDGACVSSCLSQQTKCSGRCVALETDNVNCGACGVTCAAGQVCNGGICDVTCAPPLTTCGTAGDGGASGEAGTDTSAQTSPYCAHTDTDEANCGGCGLTCASGQQCDDGVCSATCTVGEMSCGSAGCRDFSTDMANCGGCGVTCAAGQVCSGGNCQATCGEPYIQCGSACANTASDPTHCGACATSCAPQNARAAACIGGGCSYARCQVGFADCDGNAVNGCERAVSNDAANCGACGNHCNGVNVATNVCHDGVCGYNACHPRFGDCDGDTTNGCETDLSAATSCGACGKPCSGATPACSSSLTCAAGTPSYFLPDYGPTVTLPTTLEWTLATVAPAQIFYTLDGSTPTTASTHGASPVVLNDVALTDGSTTVVKWFTFDGTTSPVQTRTVSTSYALQHQATTWSLVVGGIRMTSGSTVTSSVIQVQPGATVAANIHLRLTDSCATCSDAYVFGISGQTVCFTDKPGAWPGQGGTGDYPLAKSFTAPSTAGAYPLQLYVALGTDCTTAAPAGAQAIEAGTALHIGYIGVAATAKSP